MTLFWGALPAPLEELWAGSSWLGGVGSRSLLKVWPLAGSQAHTPYLWAYLCICRNVPTPVCRHLHLGSSELAPLPFCPVPVRVCWWLLFLVGQFPKVERELSASVSPVYSPRPRAWWVHKHMYVWVLIVQIEAIAVACIFNPGAWGEGIPGAHWPAELMSSRLRPCLENKVIKPNTWHQPPTSTHSEGGKNSTALGQCCWHWLECVARSPLPTGALWIPHGWSFS